MICLLFVDKFWQEGWAKVRMKQREALKKEMREKAKPRYQMEDHKQCMLVKFYRSHPLRKLSPGRRQLRGCDSGWGFCCGSE